MTRPVIAIIGAGPYGLSLAAHMAERNIEHRIFGSPMQFWSQIAEAGGERYLKSYCFGTNISTPRPGYSFADYSEPRGSGDVRAVFNRRFCRLRKMVSAKECRHGLRTKM